MQSIRDIKTIGRLLFSSIGCVTVLVLLSTMIGGIKNVFSGPAK